MKSATISNVKVADEARRTKDMGSTLKVAFQGGSVMDLGVGVTAETLRHYDRQGLAGPSERDEVSGYRYYTEADLIRLRVAKALRDMGLSIPEAKALLDSDDLGWVASRLREAESSAGERIEEIAAAKARIAAARESCEAKLAGGQARVAEERTYPERRILVSDSIAWPSLGALWGYLRHFHAQAGDSAFDFEDSAGIAPCGEGGARMFAVCSKWGPEPETEILPAGKWSCRRVPASEARQRLQEEAGRSRSAVLMVIVTGILAWEYELQSLA